ncbi:hypothetical protein GQ43DRAFT_472874 [Delitschia confertaspora ATCC 74209]|uniref:Uncharacterized protein n=1 Tax=Delitschia confertaspora ATCC 74209 TaxID=1513339 RepID=A0A9P4JJE3_9PLEO|nr:hypothetical protein GQ43DRAFT_472874 [Delitschia confertaspora ATCC 74209]
MATSIKTTSIKTTSTKTTSIKTTSINATSIKTTSTKTTSTKTTSIKATSIKTTSTKTTSTRATYTTTTSPTNPTLSQPTTSFYRHPRLLHSTNTMTMYSPISHLTTTPASSFLSILITYSLDFSFPLPLFVVVVLLLDSYLACFTICLVTKTLIGTLLDAMNAAAALDPGYDEEEFEDDDDFLDLLLNELNDADYL